MEHRGRPDVFSWLKPNEHSKVDELSLKGVTLVELAYVSKYRWVAAEMVGILSILSIETAIHTANIVVEDPSYWLVLHVVPLTRSWFPFMSTCSLGYDWDFLCLNLRWSSLNT